MAFINRQRELDLLSSRANSGRAELLVVYGRRRIGKTSLWVALIDPDDDSVLWTDDDLERMIDNYVTAAGLAKEVGFQFVDVKACHGYLLHEFLSAHSREGRFGGDLDGRTRVLRTIIGRIRNEHPDRSSPFAGMRDGP